MEVRVVEVHREQVRPMEVSVAEVRPAQVRPPGFRSVLSPLVPCVYSLSNYLEVCFGGHRYEMGVNRKQ